MTYPQLYQYIKFKKENKHDKLYKMLLFGKVLKIDYKECFYVVDADYGLDIIKFTELKGIMKLF